ncbi:MAG: hypothetical protein NTV34_02595 [Proteobacteria bacterium]|nr:hypothetical protein [Pseudomonadota bacterium]
MENSLKYIVLAVLFLFSYSAEASEVGRSNQDVGKVERVGGTFVVTSIKRIPEGGFTVIFDSKSGEPLFKRLILESPHIRVSVSEGREIRLSADILSFVGATAEVSQMVLFVPGRVGDTPVWLLSMHSRPVGPPAKLLEMHVPALDYQIL